MEKPQKLPSGRWRARIYRDGRKVSLGTYDTQDDAYEAQLNARKYQDEKKGNIKFWRYAEAYLNSNKDNWAPGTWENYVRDYNNHLRPTFGEKKLTDVTPTMVRRWWGAMEGKKGPRRSSYFVLSQIMKQAVEDGEIQKWVSVKGASRTVANKRPSVSIETVNLLKMLSADPQVSVVIQVLVSSGLRIGEVLALNWEDFDALNRTLRVSKRQTRFGEQDGRKKHADADILQPISSMCTEALKQWREFSGPGAIFKNMKGKRLTYYDWHHRWDKLRAEFGLKEVHTHDIRSTHLTEFAKHATLKDLMERGGHSDVRSALIYQRPSVERQKQLVSQLEGIF